MPCGAALPPLTRTRCRYAAIELAVRGVLEGYSRGTRGVLEGYSRGTCRYVAIELAVHEQAGTPPCEGAPPFPAGGSSIIIEIKRRPSKLER